MPTGFFTSFDGGRTWIDGQVPFGRGNNAGDPAPAFDAKHGVALMASLDFQRPPEGGEASNGNIAVSRSRDGGRTWSEPAIAMTGVGADSDPAQVFWDKEFLTVDNYPDSPHYGRAYVTATQFLGGPEYQESPIYLSYSDDGGRSWSEPTADLGFAPELHASRPVGRPTSATRTSSPSPRSGPTARCTSTSRTSRTRRPGRSRSTSTARSW